VESYKHWLKSKYNVTKYNACKVHTAIIIIISKLKKAGTLNNNNTTPK